MKLAELQQLFWAIAAGEGESRTQELARAFVSSAQLDAESRMEIYADMYLWRQIDVLREDFPKTAALLGDDAFFALGAAYVRAHPSTHHSLSKLGQHLPVFLKRHEAARPDLSDLAALEWARALVFEAADAMAASPERLAEIAARDFANASLALVPALRSLRLEHDVVELWRELDDGRAPSPPRRAPTFVVVWRKRLDVFHVQVRADEARALALAAAGEPLGRICEAFGERPDAVEAAFKAIASWFAEGFIADREEDAS